MIASRRHFLLGAASAAILGSLPIDMPAALAGPLSGSSPGQAALTDIVELRRLIAVTIERCLNPPWMISDTEEIVAVDIRPGSFTLASRVVKMPNDEAWEALDKLYARYLELMGGKDAPMTATELRYRQAVFLKAD